MPLRNTATRFGSVSIALHWLGALAIVLMLGSALGMYVHRVDPERQLPYVLLHAAMGTTFAALILARVAWHFAERQPLALSPGVALNRVARLVHAVLLALIAAQILTGPLTAWSGGFAIDVFDWASLPSPFGPAEQAWHGAIGNIHAWTGLVIALLVAVHLAGVAKTLLLDDDDTIARMLGLAGRDAPEGSNAAGAGCDHPEAS